MMLKMNASCMMSDYVFKMPEHHTKHNESSQISALPESIYKLGCLEYLRLSGCSRISKLPESFGDLKCMVHLEMSGCTGISALPGSFGKLANLQHLELSNCSSLQEIPESLCGITQLQQLNLSSCDSLERLPDAIGNLADLQYLNMSKCRKIEKLPKSMMKLQNLLHLQLSQCGAVTEWLLLGGLSGLTALQHLDMSWIRIRCCRKLESLPDSIGTLGLESLHQEGVLDELMDQATSLVHYSRTLPVFKVLTDDVSGCRKLQLLEGAHHISELRILSLENARHLPNCSNLPVLGQLPHLESLVLSNFPSIKKIGWEFCGGNGAFSGLSSFDISFMEGLEWSTTYSAEDGVEEEFMFPVLDNLSIWSCPRLSLKPCPPTFRECEIWCSDQVLSSFKVVHKISHHTSSSRATKLELTEMDCQSMEVFHHFSTLRVLKITHSDKLTTLPESMRHLTSLWSLTLDRCKGISTMPDWLDDLPSLTTFVITGCHSIKSFAFMYTSIKAT
ncbi:hypothetical protein U9M48_001444 [Paspalum notatum var. saurae]|uniref:Disease resistance R13L4/SHOC-2-like LRR domain-containing protein n=1 Tax=Paspalum notatum var. saurae TaxID=547442 RepID=A0AAQ3SIZ3_PASNO